MGRHEIRWLGRRAPAIVALAVASAMLVCTALAGSARAADHRVSEQATAAAETAMRWYDPETGLWKTTNWWNAANILTGLMDLDLEDHSRRYAGVAANTWAQAVDQQGGNFTNEYLDDTGWWGLAWLRAYELTGEQRYLDTGDRRRAAHVGLPRRHLRRRHLVETAQAATRTRSPTSCSSSSRRSCTTRCPATRSGARAPATPGTGSVTAASSTTTTRSATG